MLSEKPFVLPLDLKIYSLEAIKKAAYRFADRTSILVKPESDHAVNVVFDFQESVDDEMIKTIISDFKNELLDQDLRLRIFEETKNVRNLILAHAFSRSSLISPKE